MDFDSIISFLLILLFFIFPTLLKRFNKKKKTAGTSPAGKARKLSLFEKLGEQIREYAQTLEQEAQKGKQPRENMWDRLAENEEEYEEAFQANDKFQANGDPLEQEIDMAFEQIEPEADPSVLAAQVMPENIRKRATTTCEKQGQKQGLPGTLLQPKLSCNLQQAIIWSEILSKPVALRQDRTRI